ncbi:MAG: flagellar export protein FliJ [Deltaproteobacteria bacterium]|jgi:flagellar FliJ protein|nr:flagellar export protein FliJ [Deltaproteobacteria bacterium]
MAVFKFRLEFLLNLRRKREEEAAAKQAKRLKSIRELEAKILDIEESRERLSSDLTRKGAEGGLTPALISLYGEYRAKLLQDLRKADELLVLSQRELSKEQAALRKAVTERQLMEKIKEKKQEIHKEEELRKEQNTLEEMAALVKAHKARMENDGN